MRIKTLAIAVIALAALAAPASAGAVTLIGSGSVAAQPVLQAALRHLHEAGQPQGQVRLHRQRRQRRRQRRPERDQPVRRQRPHPPPQRRRDDLHQDVHGRALPRRQQEEQAQQHHDPAGPRHLPGPDHQLEPDPRLRASTTTIDPVGRDTNGGTYNFFLQAVLNNEPPASNVNALTADGLVAQRGQTGPERDRLRRSRLAGQASKPLKVNGVPCKAAQDQRRAAQVPALALPVHGPPGRRQSRPGAAQVHRLDAAQPAGR